MLNSDDELSFPTTQLRSVRTFASLQDAIDFMASCLESGTAIQLLAEIYAVSQQVGRSRAVVDRFKAVFEQMQALHRQENLREHYRSAHFPLKADSYELAGILTRQCDLSVQFLCLDRGWVLERIDYL